MDDYQENYIRNHVDAKICKHCGSKYWPSSPAQQYCNSREDNPACDDDRINQKLWEKGKHPLQLRDK